MSLSDSKVLELMKKGEIYIEPFKERNLGPNSYDLRLASPIRVSKKAHKQIDITKDVPPSELVELPYTISPFETVTFNTKEIVGCKSETLGVILPRSNSCTIPLLIYGVGLLDTGYRGTLKGLITNFSPNRIVLREDLRVCQIVFFEAQSVDVKYHLRESSKYMGQTTVPEFKIDKEWRERE